MANTYTQIHIQFVFAVKHRAALIHNDWEIQFHKYITGIAANLQHKMLAINGMPDHLHMFIGLHPTMSVSDVAEKVKASSSKWVNDHKLTGSHFNLQSGYGAFSYSKSQIGNVCRYIENQKKHHHKKSFLEEYREFLVKFGVEYD